MTLCLRPLLFAFILAALASATSIREVDFKNFSYPFIQPMGVPDVLRWMNGNEKRQITLKNGAFQAPADFETYPESTLTFDRTEYGRLQGFRDDIAAVQLTFHTGGTATWQYVYLYSSESRKPRLVGWFETGSRGASGLYRLYFDRGMLIVELNDPDKRQGDCCSSGYIRIQYKWLNGTFQETGKRTTGDIPLPEKPLRY